MPTLSTHQQRQVAEGFGADAGRYDRARPDYPADLVRRIIAASPGPSVPDADADAGTGIAAGSGPSVLDVGCGTGTGAGIAAGSRPSVLDVGCGTGIAARQFQAAGCQVLGVDIDPRMAATAREQGLDVEVAPFESWEPAGRTFDVVIAGQTWHWIDPVAGAAKAASALRRPGGRLALFWNVFQPPQSLAVAFAAAYRQIVPALPAVDLTEVLATYQQMFDKAADGIRQSGAFGDPQEWRFDWERTYTRAEWLDQVPTHGGANQLPPAKLSELVEGLGAAIDAVGGSFPMHYTTVALTATRRG